jgi:hypothetical protein
MNAMCGVCGKAVEFQPERKGLLEKCTKCGEVFRLDPVEKPELPPPPIPNVPNSMQSPPVAQFFSIALLVGSVVAGLVSFAVNPFLAVFLVLVPGVFLIIIMAQLSEVLALMRRAEVRDIERDKRFIH